RPRRLRPCRHGRLFLRPGIDPAGLSLKPAYDRLRITALQDERHGPGHDNHSECIMFGLFRTSTIPSSSVGIGQRMTRINFKDLVVVGRGSLPITFRTGRARSGAPSWSIAWYAGVLHRRASTDYLFSA